MAWTKIWESGLKRLRALLGGQERGSGYDPEFVRALLRDSGNLKRRYADFKRIISENDRILDIMAELSDKASLATASQDYLVSRVELLLDHVLVFIEALNSLSGQKYPWLYDTFEALNDQLMEALEGLKERAPQRYVYLLKEFDLKFSLETGAKAAALAEARNHLGLTTPEGFVVGIRGFQRLLLENQLESFIQERLSGLNIGVPERVRQASAEIREAILAAEIPEDLLVAMEQALAQVGAPYWAVRSSALGEDGQESFAGQFVSRLNIPSCQVPRSYLEVLASLYDERALFYKLAKGLRLTGAMMAVLILEMIPARVSGVLYTFNPSRPTAGEMLISSLWGLGKLAVGGDIHPDVFILDRETGRLKEQRISTKNIMAVAKEGGGLEEVPVPGELRDRPSLDAEALRRLYQMALALEEHFGSPQDIEWCFDERGWLYLLQTRDLKARAAVSLSSSVAVKPLFRGQPVSAGVAAGAIYLVRQPEDLSHLPPGAIAVVPNMDPDLAKFVPRMAGLIALRGSPTTHLATILREFEIPAVVLTGASLDDFRNGQMVTLDALRGEIFEGVVEEVLKARKELALISRPSQTTGEGELKRLFDLILPLTLEEIPEDGSLPPSRIRTIHDIVRFVHEMSLREMFEMGAGAKTNVAHILRSPRIPMIFYVIDLEGGLDPRAVFRREITIEDIRSLPFLALWRGMTHEGISWAGPVTFDLGGFVSVVSRSFVRTEDMSGKAYALISRDYLNFHSHLAYHFAVVDSFCSQQAVVSNYVAFRFQGGGAGLEGRLRRVTVLKEILSHLGFRVKVKGDRITAVIRGTSLVETEEALDQLGRLMAYVRQMDMAATDEAAVKRYIEAFLKEDYTIVQR
ncbi:hypothetical protein G4V39_08630 [Thermosulfuriphilus ammonigenes]|uniref:Phosphoenolpyruvate synthase n=1 Tax=Thermosulfuriphilus ammonigenes TaxID=1936021 RepID=A0A6G7PXE7_9BACT|nr:PEP/pyruvate-binding domain-containing protein [Thermosulfuriphilus ammonigenes]MBA2849562.1 pyruvate,water dikinase [Thermosulfuriphilus ammonigenes]QIJ72332.1 hypothetical protein G4V39_08630 [Thermosulfuriphilus ammonigenes]